MCEANCSAKGSPVPNYALPMGSSALSPIFRRKKSGFSIGKSASNQRLYEKLSRYKVIPQFRTQIYLRVFSHIRPIGIRKIPDCRQTA